MSMQRQTSRRSDSGDAIPQQASAARAAAGKQPRTARLADAAPVQRREADVAPVQLQQQAQAAAPAADQQQAAPGQQAGAEARVSTQDIQYEIVAHKLGYQDTVGTTEAQLLTRWGYQDHWISKINDAATGFFCGLIMPEEGRSDLTPIVVFRGTGDFKDVVSDINPVAVGYDQFHINERFVAQMIAEAGGRVDVTGHSLGGALAQHAAAAFTGNVHRVVTFQSPAIDAGSARAFAENEQRPSVTHHIAGGDLVDTAGDQHLGGEFFRHTPGGGPLSHTKFLLTTPEFAAQRQELGLTDEVLAQMGIDRQTNHSPIEHHQEYPHPIKNAIDETVRRGVGAVLYPILTGIGVLTRTDDASLRQQILQAGESGLAGTPVSERAYMIDRLCRGMTGDEDEEAILTVLRASTSDAVAVIDVVDPYLIAENVHGSQYQALRAFFRANYYTQCSQDRAVGLIQRCIEGRTSEWEEEVIADILEARSDGRAILARIGSIYRGGGFDEGLDEIQWQLDGAEQDRVDARYANA